MPVCENCLGKHDGSYGSGRFCIESCARKYASNTNKIERGKKTSKALKEKWKRGPPINPEWFKTSTKKALEAQKRKRELLYQTGSWEEIPFLMKRQRVFEEQHGQCDICKISSWLGKPLTLHFDHIDGNRKNGSRGNVRFLCPNCHSQTPTYCGKKRKLEKFSKTTKK